MPISLDTSTPSWPQSRYSYDRGGAGPPPPPLSSPDQDRTSYQKLTTTINDQKSKGVSQTGKIECQTCKNRKYQDGSDDPGVSFKTAAHIDPGNASAAVMSHEQEHVKNESAKAVAEKKDVVSQSVSLESSICPECGRVYISGGKTLTVTRSKNNEKNSVAEFYDRARQASGGHTLSIKA